MPLQKQQFELSFNSGLDLKTDEKLVLPAKLLTLENGIFVKGGTIQKRYGYSYYLSDYKPIWGLNTVNWDLTPKSLNSYQSELLMSTNKSLLSYGLEKDFWMEKDNISPFIATYETIINDKLSKDRPDMVISNGVEVYAYNDSEGVKCTVIDSVSKTVYQYNTLLDATGHSARVVSVGNSVFIFYISSTGTYSILGKKIDTAYPHTLAQNYLELPTVTTTFTIGANNSDGHLLDAITVGNKAFVVWSKKVSGTNPPLIRMSYVAASGATASGVGISLPTAKDIPNSYATTSLTCLYNNINKTIWIAVGNNPTTQIPSTKTNPGLYACILDTNLTLTTGTNLPAILPFTKIDNDVTWDIVNLTGEFITDNLVKWFYEYEARDIYSLANTIKYSYNAHLIDITQHTFADTTHKVTAPDATDLTSLGTLLTQMHAKYVLHDDDAELAGGWSYHYAQEAADHSLAALGGLGSLALCRVCILDMVLKIGSPTGHINDATAHNYGGRHLITATESVTDLNRIYTNILSQTRIVGNREVFKLNVGLATKAFYQDISDRSNDYVYSLASVTGLANGIITVSSSIFNVGDYVLIADTSSVPATGYIVGITDIGGTPTEYELHIQTLPINGTDVDLSMYSTGDSAFIIAIPSDKIYVGVTYASPLASINEFLDDLQPSYFILDSRGKVRGKLLSQKGIGYMSHPLPSITEVGDKYYCSLGQSLRLESDASSVVRSVDGVSVVEMDFDSSYLNFGKEINNIFYFTGAQVESYDGSAVVEAGFHTFPEGITITTVSSGGFIEDGDHIYKTIWRWRDRRGNLHRSSPSFGVTMTSAGGSDSTNTLIIPSLTITNKSDVVCEIYRNILLGSTFYKVGEVANNSLTETITFADTLADSSIDSKELLYTLGGELENIAPPSCRLIDIWKNRIFVVTDDEFIWYTKERYDNIAMEFNDFGFTKYIHPEGGKTSAIVGLDSNLILFKQERIYFINGEGANSFGQNGNLSDMQLITTDYFNHQEHYQFQMLV